MFSRVEDILTKNPTIPQSRVEDLLVQLMEGLPTDEHIRDLVGSPLKADTVSEMTDDTKIYIYTGSETGYTAGHWYYYNGSSWADGGVYNSAGINTDKTLSVEDKAADGKAVGDEISDLKSDLNDELTNIMGSLSGLPNIEDSDATGVDLDVSDEDGNVIVRFKDGHIQTKNFDSNSISTSAEIQNSDVLRDVDLDVSDTAGNVLMRLDNGHIQTKEFNSALLIEDVAGKMDIQQDTSDVGNVLTVLNDGSVAPVPPSANVLFDLFSKSGKPLYHHMNQEKNNPYIPAQSLYDVRYAKALGFDMIEVNAHKCSDGVFVCKHGIDNALGAGIKDAINNNDYSNVLFENVTSAWIRENVRYNSIAEKYCGWIPTLDEMCGECKKLGLKIKVAGLEAALVAQKYMPDYMIWATDTNRGSFRGTIERGWRNNVDIDERIEECKLIGAPLTISIGSTLFSTYTDAEIKELVEKAHANGFTVGINYPTTPYDFIRAAKLGVDYGGSTENAVNLFSNGKALHITSPSNSSLILSDGATYDSTADTISVPSGASVSCAADMKLGVASLIIRYSGTLTITVGTENAANEIRNRTSDGSEYVFLANVLPYNEYKWSKWFKVLATANTTIYELTCDGNVIE